MGRRLGTTIAATAAFAFAATAAALGTSSDGGAEGPPGDDDVALEGWSGRASTARLLRPDMFSLRARDLKMSVRSGFRVLRFSSLLANGGPGPMVVRPRPRAGCPPGHRLARQ